MQANIDYQYLVNFVYSKIKFSNLLPSVFIKIGLYLQIRLQNHADFTIIIVTHKAENVTYGYF